METFPMPSSLFFHAREFVYAQARLVDRLLLPSTKMARSQGD